MVQADGADEGCVTFVLHDEDHTLGNSLRYMIMKNADVEFCGYTITHPSESKINFRIQTRGGIPAAEPLRRGLNELSDVCQHVLNTFQARVNEFKERQEQPMEWTAFGTRDSGGVGDTSSASTPWKWVTWTFLLFFHVLFKYTYWGAGGMASSPIPEHSLYQFQTSVQLLYL